MACQRHHFSKLHVLFESKSTTCCVCKSSPGLPLDRVCRRWTPVGPPGHRGSLHFFNCCCLPQTSSLPSHFQIFRIGHGVLGAARTRHEWWMMVTSTKSRLYIYMYILYIYNLKLKNLQKRGIWKKHEVFPQNPMFSNLQFWWWREKWIESSYSSIFQHSWPQPPTNMWLGNSWWLLSSLLTSG